MPTSIKRVCDREGRNETRRRTTRSTTADADLLLSLFLYFVLGLLLFGRVPFYASETGLATGDRGGVMGWGVAERSRVKGKTAGGREPPDTSQTRARKKKEERNDKLNDEEDGYV